MNNKVIVDDNDIVKMEYPENTLHIQAWSDPLNGQDDRELL